MSGTNSTLNNLAFGLNAQNDLILDETNNMSILTGLNALIQSCEARIEAQQREMIYAYNKGNIIVDAVFRETNLPLFIAKSRRLLLTVVNVLQVNSFSASVNNGRCLYTATILTAYSPTLVNISNAGI